MNGGTAMAAVKEYLQIPLDKLEIGRGQARTRDVAAGIPELADSIKKVGLLEPIVVCESKQAGKYEILTGQRRFLAHLELGLDTIWAAVLDSSVDEITAKVISVTENLVRRDLNPRDLIDACTYLYKQYGSARAVADETGLPYSDVLNYVKYDRLRPELRELYDKGEVELRTALRAQDAAEVMGGDVASNAIALVNEMKPMTYAQQKKLASGVKSTPDKPLDETIEAAKTGAQITQIVVTIGIELLQKLQLFAQDEHTSQNEAAATLIEEGLERKGYRD